MEEMMTEHVLVVGATGLIGRRAMEHFARTKARTTALSRRRPLDTYGAHHIALDLTDERACTEALAELNDVTQVVFAALHEEADLVSGWLDDRHLQRNAAMLRNVVEVIVRES